MLKSRLVFGLWLLLCSFIVSAAIDVYQFDDPEKEKRFQTLAFELRCPKCQNQNLADSNAEIAQDLRAKIYQMLNADKSDADIVDYMVARYGDFVLYEPRVKPQTYILWFGPAILLIFGLLVIFLILRSRNKKADGTEESNAALTATEAKALNALLNTKKGKKG